MLDPQIESYSNFPLAWSPSKFWAVSLFLCSCKLVDDRPVSTGMKKRRHQQIFWLTEMLLCAGQCVRSTQILRQFTQHSAIIVSSEDVTSNWCAVNHINRWLTENGASPHNGYQPNCFFWPVSRAGINFAAQYHPAYAVNHCPVETCSYRSLICLQGFKLAVAWSTAKTLKGYSVQKTLRGHAANMGVKLSSCCINDPLCKIWYLNGLIFKVSPIWARICSNLRKFGKKMVILVKILLIIRSIGI